MIARVFQRVNSSPFVEAVKHHFSTVAFFAGFIWDAITIGVKVGSSDLLILSVYLLGTIPIIWWLAKKSNPNSDNAEFFESPEDNEDQEHWKSRLPFMLLQFLYGSLFSALFILYFKSSSHLAAIFWSIGLGVLLVANEFFENSYRRFTLTWTLFGLCAILVLNFVLPYIIGSVHAIWFFLSIILALVITTVLKRKISASLGSIIPTYIVAFVLASAYVFDFIPPVPLVKRDIQIGTQLQKVPSKQGFNYVLQQDYVPKWYIWRKVTNGVIHIKPGEGIYCISAIFAPRGIHAKLYHNWQYYDDKKGWKTMSRIPFEVSGGRDNGFRGYTLKGNLKYGEWRVNVETENARTITVYEFEVKSDDNDQAKMSVAL